MKRRSIVAGTVGLVSVAVFMTTDVVVHGQTQPAMPAATGSSNAQPAPEAFTPAAHVEKRGEGPIAMVLIPGLSCDWTVYEAFMDRNAAKYTMYAVTLPGFGGSEPPPTPAEGQYGAWLDNAANAVWKVVEEKKIEKPVIVGHSLGGHLALRIGTEHAKDIRAVVAIDGAPAFPFGATPAETTKEDRVQMAEMMAQQFEGLSAEQMAASQRVMVQSMVTDPKRGEALAELCVKVPAATTIQYMVDLIAADIRDQLPNLTVPALVTPSAATNDAEMIRQNHEAWTALMKGAPKATLAFFDDTRHFIMDDRPAELDAAIADFLAGREVKGYAATAPAVSEPATGAVAHPAAP